MDDWLKQMPPWFVMLIPLVSSGSDGLPLDLSPRPRTEAQEREADAWLISWIDGEGEELTDEIRWTIWPRMRAVSLFLRSGGLYNMSLDQAPDPVAARVLLVDSRLMLQGLLERVDEERN
jgi:hypothetical protein